MARGKVSSNPFHIPSRDDLRRRANIRYRELKQEGKTIDLRKKKKKRKK